MLLILLIILVVAAIWFVKVYNHLQKMANDVKRTKANIMASTQKKLDLCQRLMDICKSYGEHEKLTQIATAQQVSSIGDAMVSSRTADRVIGQVSSLAMAYPDLKANGTYQQLMNQLHLIETDLQQRREQYNGSVSFYNTYRCSLPQNIIAGKLGFPEAQFYQVSSDGNDGVGDFKTDDGKMLRDTFAKIGQRAGELGARASRQIESAVTDMRSPRKQTDNLLESRSTPPPLQPPPPPPTA
jgi:LemA protein